VANDLCTGLSGFLFRFVGRAIVDDDDVLQNGQDTPDQGSDPGGFVQARNDDDTIHGRYLA